MVRDEKRFVPVGTAVAIGPRTALSCAHVVLKDLDDPARMALDEPVWVAFPQVASAWKQRRRVVHVDFDADDPQTADVAVLHLDEDVPTGVEPARLRLLDPAVLRDRRWWAFGFPASSSSNGNDAFGTVGTVLANGWVRLDTGSRYVVERGFSGGGLWLPDYQAVAGIVGKALTGGRQEGDAQALTLFQADVFLPQAKLRVVAGWAAPDAGPAAMAAWGWQLADDPEAGRHWRPRGRGVMAEHEPGYRFAGRTAALREIVGWLDRPTPDGRVLVVTGSPGVGKSAVLGRVVTTADAALRAQLPGSDGGVRAVVGSVGCAVHVKGKTALDVAVEIARAAGVALPEQVEQLPGLLRQRLAAEPGRRFNLVIDAVDEAYSPAEARLVLAEVIVPLVQACGPVGVQVVCGTRRADGAGELLRALAGAQHEIDLDDPAFFELADLVTYAEASLRLVGAERPGNPYTDAAVAAPIAARIAALADRNFLIAGLEARRRGLNDTVAVHPAAVTLTATVDATLQAYLQAVPAVVGVTARDVLTALAYAEAPGWSSRLWHTATAALGYEVAEPDLDRFARTAAASFLVETTAGDVETSTFRLFHQALNDALLRDRGRGGVRTDEQHLTHAFHALGRELGWAEPYLARSLARHADRAGLIDTLLTDDGYLLHADLLRLLRPANHARTSLGWQRARMLHLTLPAVTAAPAERAAMFSVTCALECLPSVTLHPRAPYHAQWAAAEPRAELRRLTGHTSWVRAVCPIEVDGRTLLATGSHDRTVRVWDPATGTELRRLTGHTDRVRAVCPIEVDGRTLLATGSHDRTVRVWDPVTGTELRRLTGHTDRVRAVCPIEVDGRTLLATGSGGMVRVWDPATGTELRRFTGRTGGVWVLCPVEVEGRTLLATGDDRTVRVWDPATGTELRQLTGHTGGVDALCPVEVDGRTLLATGHARTVRVWDPATGTELRQLTGHTDRVRALCPVEVDGRTLLATGSRDGTVRVWDPATGTELRQLTGHTGGVDAVCPVEVDGRALLATGSDDRTVRMWDPGTELRRLTGHTGWVDAVCPIEVDGRTLLVTGSHDWAVRVWDPATGTELRQLTGHTDRVLAACAVELQGRTLLATSSGGTVRIWDPATGTELRQVTGHTGWVLAACAVEVDGRTLLATGSRDGTVRIWDPATGTELRQVTGHTGWVDAVCPVEVDGRTLLVTGSHDRTVRVWDPATATELRRLTGHTGWVLAACAVEVDGRTLLATSSGGTVRIWDPATGTELRQLTGHTDRVRALYPVQVDSRTLLATGDDGTVRVWDPGTGQLIYRVPVHHGNNGIGVVAGKLALALTAGVLVIDITPGMQEWAGPRPRRMYGHGVQQPLQPNPTESSLPEPSSAERSQS
ncbi:hypothetical protein [Dactylosporangium salmoneum]|uniref:hypothetical protein n=1 Tax=Dactylosporangium salmoneum TaxID=53361 RepID=UPI0031D08285